MQQFKGSISKQVGFSLWQKSFYDHIIRNEEEYLKVCEYIETNPLKWQEDSFDHPLYEAIFIYYVTK
jgi:putative transposase